MTKITNLLISKSVSGFPISILILVRLSLVNLRFDEAISSCLYVILTQFARLPNGWCRWNWRKWWRFPLRLCKSFPSCSEKVVTQISRELFATGRSARRRLLRIKLTGSATTASTLCVPAQPARNFGSLRSKPDAGASDSRGSPSCIWHYSRNSIACAHVVSSSEPHCLSYLRWSLSEIQLMICTAHPTPIRSLESELVSKRNGLCDLCSHTVLSVVCRPVSSSRAQPKWSSSRAGWPTTWVF